MEASPLLPDPLGGETQNGDTALMGMFASQTESIIKPPVPQVISHIVKGINRDIDEDEERAHKATDYADYDGGRDIPQGGLFVVKLTEFQSTGITERKCGAGPERVVNAEEEGADGASRKNTPKHAERPESVRFGYFIAE